MTDEDLKHLIELTSSRTREAFELIAERLTAENRHHFDVSTEAIKHEVRLVAEAVVHLEQKVDREVTRLDEGTQRGFTETQAMIKFSHAELDRRVGKLEQAFADLQARVERLETTTH